MSIVSFLFVGKFRQYMSNGTNPEFDIDPEIERIFREELGKIGEEGPIRTQTEIWQIHKTLFKARIKIMLMQTLKQILFCWHTTEIGQCESMRRQIYMISARNLTPLL